jgi:hemerythrin-like domain-containing protein
METISSYLADDHHRCDKLLATVCASIRAGQWHQAERELCDFTDALERHLQLEDVIVFPAFEKALARAGGADKPPFGQMHIEHLRMRAVTKRMADSHIVHDARAFLDHAHTLALALCLHGEREEGVLYPLIDRMLQTQRDEIIAEMRAFGAFDHLMSTIP